MNKPQKKKQNFKLKWKKIFVTSFFIFVLIVASVCFLYFPFQIYFADKVLPGTYFAGQNVGGMDKAFLSSFVRSNIDKFLNSSVQIQVGNDSRLIKVSDLGVSYDSEGVSKAILDAGRNSSLLDSFAYVIGKNSVAADYNLDFQKLNAVLENDVYSGEILPQDSTIEFLDSSPVIKTSKKGHLVDRSRLLGDLGDNLVNLANREIEIGFIDQEPDMTEDKVKNAFEKVSALSKQQLILTYGYDKWTLSGKSLFDLMNFYPYKQQSEHAVTLYLGRNPIFIDKLYLDKPLVTQLDVGLDEAKFDRYLKSISKVIDKPTHDAALRFENGKVFEFSSAQDGQILDNDKTKTLVLQKLTVDFTQKDSSILIQLPVKVTKAKIANEQINSLGIKELVGSGVSYFAGSIPNRVSNIVLGSSLINGTLVKPGEVFSFVGLVGPVSKDQGFKQAYVINAGKTVLDDGGGICQVSTTVFRAALNSGFPILKRTAHAYRVGYYEQHGFKPGFDATIFSPSVDFQFTNDSTHHILVQTTVDRTNARLQVDIYGTLDDRKVEISDAVVSNISAAPAPRFQDDPTLPTGTTKQVDFAAPGATSVFTRKVYKGGQLILDDVFKSNFRPWQAVYLVGKG